MESPTLAAMAVSAESSEFFRTELEAFVETSKRQRPKAWARVEQLKRACRSESPADLAGVRPSVQVLAEQAG